MTLPELRTLLEYHYWARDRVLAAAEALTADQYTRDMGNSFRSIRDTLVHVYSAEWVWHSRWEGQVPSGHIAPDRLPTVRDLRAAWTGHEPKVKDVVERTASGPQGLDRVFHYTLFNGKESASVFWHMVQHVVNHATYHRGQVTTMLRQLGAEPAKPLDLIAFYRERFPPA